MDHLLQISSASTGDIHKNIETLKSDLRSIQCPVVLNDVQRIALRNGDPALLLDILDYSLLKFSPLVKNEALDAPGSNELRNESSDQAFLGAVFRVLRHCFSYHPILSVPQFLSSGFAERKIIICQDVTKLCKALHAKLQRESSSGTRPVRPSSTQRMRESHSFNSRFPSPRRIVSAGAGRRSSMSGDLSGRSSRNIPSRSPSPCFSRSGPPLPSRRPSGAEIANREELTTQNATLAKRIEILEGTVELLARNCSTLFAALVKSNGIKTQSEDFALAEIKSLTNYTNSQRRGPFEENNFPTSASNNTYTEKHPKRVPSTADVSSLQVSFQGPCSDVFGSDSPELKVDQLLKSLEGAVSMAKENSWGSTGRETTLAKAKKVFPGILGSPPAEETPSEPNPWRKKVGPLETPAFGRVAMDPGGGNPSYNVEAALSNTRQWMQDLESMHVRYNR